MSEPTPYERIESFLPEPEGLGLDGYEVLRPIGEGGFGRVYLARQASFARDVAIKVLGASGMKDETIRRFERECQAVGALAAHPHIVTIHDSGISRWGKPYIVMEHMAGGSFAERVTREGPLPWPEAVEVTVKIAAAVETAHRAGILHRDIKPENLLLSAYGEPKLADFGVASIPGGYQTHTGAITASLAHAAPEILEGRKASRASDIYALGSTLFALVSGTAAFSADDGSGLQALIARTLTQPIPDLRPNVPPPVFEVIERAMAKDPADRFVSAEAFGGALQQAQEASGVAVTDMLLEAGPALLVYSTDETPVVSENATQHRERRELTPPPVEPPKRRVIWRSPLVAAAVVVALAASTGGMLAIKARRDNDQRAASAPSGSAPTPSPAISEGAEDLSITRDGGRDRGRRETSRKPARKPRLGGGTGGGGGSFALAPPVSSGGGGGYTGSTGGGGDTSSTAPAGDGSGGSGGGSTSSGGGGGGGTSGGSGGSSGGSNDIQPGHTKTATLPLFYLWRENGDYLFTTNRDQADEEIDRYDGRIQLGLVWSSTIPGDGLAPLCLTSACREGYYSKTKPTSGAYRALYRYSGDQGLYYSVDPNATHEGNRVSFVGYIRPAY